MSTPKLYTWKESGNCYKVRLLAALLGIELELVEIDYLKDEQCGSEYHAINPRGQIPALVDRNRTFTDSAAILVYVAGMHSESRTSSSFWSNDTVEQAEIVDWLAFATGWITPGIAAARVIIRFKGVTPSSEPFLAVATTKAQKSLEVLQKKLEADDWLALGRPTVADVAVFPYVSLASQGNISLDPYPAVLNWLSRVRNLPGFIPIVE